MLASANADELSGKVSIFCLHLSRPPRHNQLHCSFHLSDTVYTMLRQSAGVLLKPGLRLAPIASGSRTITTTYPLFRQADRRKPRPHTRCHYNNNQYRRAMSVLEELVDQSLSQIMAWVVNSQLRMQDLTIPISEVEYLYMSRPTPRGYWIMDMELGICWRMIPSLLLGG